MNILIRCLVADQTLTVEHLCAITLCTLDPVAHPLAVAPAIRAEQSDLLAVQGTFQIREHRLKLALFQLLCAHCGAAKCNCIKLCQLCGVHREEQAFLASLAGLVLVLFWILPYISALFEDIKQLFTI